jgi:hypothetical protein
MWRLLGSKRLEGIGTAIDLISEFGLFSRLFARLVTHAP